MKDVVPDVLPRNGYDGKGPETAAELIEDIKSGTRRSTMAVKITPYILSLIDWADPLRDPLARQFIPLGSRIRPDHPKLSLDSLNETGDSPVKGVIHRYPDRAVFLASSVCPVYCRNCTRSYSVGADTEEVSKTRFLPIQKRWEAMFDYIERTPALRDILVSGGDLYTLSPDQIRMIGMRLLGIPHIERIRIASKGLAICPSRFIDPDDDWAGAVIDLSHRGRKLGKGVALHTHFNHPNEITWVTRLAAQRLFEEGVTVRNQTVLLNGVNNDVDTMKSLIAQLSSLNVQPYYVFQCDMVRGIEDMRTPLQEILALEAAIRGSIAGFMTPNFVVNLPGGGGKRLACSKESYDRSTGLSTFLSPISKDPSRTWEYWDPLPSHPEVGE
ncbi:kama family protein [Durotheca rogersii]|uniref:kama family protein n=1 Tax=Durotheca rogersii TaxID=419775 RepID=UPI00221F8828|nr:kama family protein [Durotheca rogersii]KAI5865915.1 kama family protein [Durotheca rogersii]